MIEYLVLTIILFYFILASYEDIKKREVYDYINFSLTFLLITIAIFHSFLINSLDPIKYIGFGILIGFTIGSILYYLGIWGGGDAKFLIGFSASSYYLINIGKNKTIIPNFYDFFMGLLSSFFSMFVNSFLNFILILDFSFLIIILISKVFFIKNENDKKNSTYLFLILFLMFLGLNYNLSNLILVLIGFIVFILIFFAEEDLFLSIYFNIKKNVLDLKERNKITTDIKFKNETIIEYEQAKFGISKENLFNIKNKITKGFDIDVKKVFPFSILIALNFITYIFKIITLDKINLQILSFLFKFLFYSFISGGLIASFLILFYYLRNLKKIKIKISKNEKMSLIFISLLILIFTIFKTKILIFLFIPLIYLLIKLTKEVEKFMFIKKKNISKIVLGDWIVQDIKIKNKLIYSSQEFKLGVNEIQLNRINELSKSNKELKNIYVKDGIAFLPPLFIGFILILLL